jgi:cation diffusion facilitator CzcD-associated flavoprotein CzcO
MSDFRVAIIGSGFSGMGMAIRLREEGMEDFVVLERADDVGGTWQANRYPGCQCDIPSHLYSFSFALNPDWSRTYSEQPEIWEYMRRTAEEYGLMPFIRFDHEVTGADWDEDEGHWRLQTSRGKLTAQVLVAAVGGLSEPAVPAVPGLEDFEGAQFHTAAWKDGHDLSGERVAVIGTGASAIQTVPSIQPVVGELKVFQRTPPWVMPHTDRPIRGFERRLYRLFPPAQRLVRSMVYWSHELMVLGMVNRPSRLKLVEKLARRHLESQVQDPELRRRLTPDYRIGCKRILPSNKFYPALQEPNVELVTDPIQAATANGIVTADGTEHELDTIIFGTGFHVTDIKAARWIRGRDGVLMSDIWGRSPSAYLGVAIAGFPNLFFISGPNTGTGHQSQVFMIESHIQYVLDALQTMDRKGVRAVEVRPDVQRAYNEELQARMPGTVWNSGGCASWYLDANGRNATIWPDFTWRFRRRTRRFEPAKYMAAA